MQVLAQADRAINSQEILEFLRVYQVKLVGAAECVLPQLVVIVLRGQIPEVVSNLLEQSLCDIGASALQGDRRIIVGICSAIEQLDARGDIQYVSGKIGKKWRQGILQFLQALLFETSSGVWCNLRWRPLLPGLVQVVSLAQ